MKFLLILTLHALLISLVKNACETNQWEDSTGACKPCHLTCASCTDQADNHCTACPSDKTLDNGFCKCSNENQYLDEQGACQNCFSSCKTCVGPIFYQCTSCDTTHGQTLMKQDWENNGTCECSDNTTFAINGAACGTCDSSCLKCLATGKNQCIKCPNGTIKQPWGYDLPGNCIIPCATKQFRDMTATDAANQICRTCSALCSNCSGPAAVECTGCIDGYFLKGKLGHPSECLQKCTDVNTYRDSDGNCSACNAACGSCFGPTKENCYYCATGYYELKLNEYFICVQSCSSGQFRDGLTDTCMPCFEHCEECKGPNNGDCLNCKTGFHKTPYYEELGQCLQEENCGTKQYRDMNDYCKPCHDTCLHCTGEKASECLECDYMLSKVPPAKDLTGNCVMLCEDSMKYRNVDDGLCKQCDVTCEECSGPGEYNCLKCMDKTKVIYPMIEGYPGQCVAPCDAHKFWNGTSCIECDTTCKECKGIGATQCLECPAGSVKEPLQKGIAGVCLVENCTGTGQFKISEPDVCGTCDTSCGTCRKEGEFGCLTCTSPKVKIPSYSDALGKCMDNTCTATQYINMADNYACTDCFSSCATCIGGSEKECLTCSSTAGFYKFPVGSDDTIPGHCIQLPAADNYSCETHKLRNMETGACEECPASCQECAGISEQKCMKCYEGMVKIPAIEGEPGQCVPSCKSHFYRLNSMGECLECHSDCLECQGSTNTDCLSCPAPNIKQPPTKNVNGSCVQQCESHKYFQITTNSCVDCNSQCLDCSGPTENDCLSCNSTEVKIPFGYENPGKCITGTCDATKYGTFDASETFVCLDCDTSCASCMGPGINDCLSCAASFAKMPPNVKYPGKCYTPCTEAHQFKDVYGDGTCKECFSNCATCLGPMHSDCLTCNTGFNKIYNSGDDTLPSICEGATWCPDHQYHDGTVCQECDGSCKACFGAGNENCLECYEGMMKVPWNSFVGGSCVNQCPMTDVPQYFDPNDQQCKNCHESCGECMGPAADDCLKCKNEIHKKYPQLLGVKGLCIEGCTEGDNYYLTNATATPITCAQCFSNCATCVDDQEGSCLTCITGFYKEPPELERVGKCVAVCTETTPHYRDSSNVCQPCNDTCGSCIGAGEWQCLTCTGSKVKIPKKDGVPGKCFSGCPDGQYLNESDFICHPCHSSCATCVGGHSFECLNCVSGLFKNPGDLQNFNLTLPGLCETFFYCPEPNQYRSLTDTACQACDASCGKCKEQGPQNCLDCANSSLGKYPYNPELPGYCLPPCPLAFQYPDPSGICKDCHESCDLCFGETETSCLSCRNASLIKYPQTEGVIGKCEMPCEDGFYRAETDWTKCEVCHFTCKTCVGSTENDCLMCKENYIKANFTYNKPGICELPCANPSEYKDIFTQTCKPCDPTCQTCTGPEKHQCKTCKPEYVPSEPYENIMVACLQKCEATIPQFRDIATNNCVDCHHSCTSCFGAGDWECLSCKEGVVREGYQLNMPTKCLPQCYPGYYFTQTGTVWSCSKCIPDCLECSGPSATECTKCPEDKEKIPKYDGPGICIGKCQFSNQYHDVAANNYECKACHADCAECAGPLESECYKCAANTEGKVKWPPAEGVIGSCVVIDCDEGKFKTASGACESCPANCKSCISANVNECIDCATDYVKFPPKFGMPTACVANPCLNAGSPAPGYIDPNDATVCLACNQSCASCLYGASDACLTCPTGFTKVPSGDGIPGVCVIACAAGFYRNFTNSSYQVCSPCNQSCATCEGPKEFECLTCQSGLFLNKMNSYMNIGTCDTFGYCPDGQYGDPATNECKNCSQTQCLICAGPAITDCKKCMDGFDKLPPNSDMTGQCVVPCLDAYTFRDADGSCKPCHTSCKICAGLLDTDCLMCKEATLVKFPIQEGVPGKCLAPCAEHQYRNSIDDYAACNDCDNSCGNCKGPSPSECLTCPINQTKIPFNPEMIGSCYINCNAANEFRGIDGNCYPCNTKCASCVGPNPNDCLTCPTNTQRLNPDIRFNTSCVNSCDLGKYWNLMNNSCDPCHYTCKTCMGSKDYECLTCQDHVVNSPIAGTFGVCGKLEQGIWCEQHYFINSTTEMTCSPCNTNCSECSGPNSNECTKCYDLHELLLTAATDMKGECMKICDSGFYRASTGECAPCDESCMECKGPSLFDCKACPIGLEKMPPAWDLLGRCVVKCTETGKYRDLDGTCKDCATECATCSGGAVNECLSCTSPKILDQTKYGVPGNCITNTCLSNQFINGTNCLNCSTDCLTCVGPNIWDCLTCATDKVKYPAQIGVPAQCVSKCDDHYYRDLSNWEFQECKPCHSSCLTCEGPEAERCLTCSDGLFFNGNLEFKGTEPGPCQTFGHCPDGSYRILSPIEKCQACHETCLKCDAETEADCLVCPSYLIKYPPAMDIKGKCLEYCQPGFYRDTASGNCTACDVSCAECVGGTDEDCLKCVEDPTVIKVKYPLTEGVPGKCLVNGTCGINQYADPADTWGCKDCNSECATCAAGTNTDCLSCPSGFYKKPLDQGVPGTCIQLCALSNQYKDSDGNCLQCDTSCLTCIGPGPENCLSCLATLVKSPPGDVNPGYCFQPCPTSHQYRSKKDFECYECHGACEHCIGNTEYDCLSCYENVEFLMFANGTKQCYTWCKEHQYKDASGACKECDPMCAECSIAGPQNCWVCWEGYVKIPMDASVVGTCYEKCQEGSYRSTDGYCKPCNSACKTCEGATENDCLSCATAGFIKVPATPHIKGQCLQNTCTSSQYLNAAGCQDCSASCLTCVGGEDYDCMTCAVGKVKFPFYVEQPGKCVDTCETGFYRKNETVCGYCDSSCATCINGTEKHCLTCTSPKVLQADASGIGICVDPCEAGFFRDIYSTYKECKPCYYSCATCTGPDPWLCKSCATGFYFNAIEGTEFGSCDIKGICDVHQFRNSSDECADCDVACKECSIIATNCTLCSYEFNLIEGKCLLPCDQTLQPSTYRDATTNLCKACHTSCYACVGPADDDCLKCALATQTKYPNIEGQKGKCFNSCASNEYFDTTSTNACAPCHTNCLKCVGGLETECLACIAGLVKKSPDPSIPSACITVNCTSSQYLSPDGTCKPCSSSCLTCAGYSENDCLSCVSTKTLFIEGGDFKGKCSAPCSTGYRKADGTCGACYKNCLTCFGPEAYNCLSCIAGLHKNPYNSTEGQCDEYGKCPLMNQFRNSQDQCQDCHSSCAECIGGTSSDCKVCANSLHIKIPSSYELPGYCAYPCSEEGRYKKTDGTCGTCHSSCLVCTGPYDYQCEVCVDTTLTKYPQLIGYPGKCLANCTATNQYYDSSMTCQNCSALCATCMGSKDSDCLTCVSGYYKLPAGETAGACYEKCATKQYRDPFNNTCMDCHALCAECIGPTEHECFACNTGYYKEFPEASFVGTCFEKCTVTTEFRGYDGQCYPCPDNCATCTNGAQDNCLTCLTGFFLNPPGSLIGRCESKGVCYKENQYRDPADNLCKDCDAACLTCFAAGADKCSSCIIGKMKIPFSPDEPGSCLDECPEGQYNSGSACANCSVECQTCTGGSSNDCLICSNHSLVKMPPAIDEPGFCTAPCADGEYASGAGSCASCDAACLSCVGATDADCLVCAGDKIKIPAELDKKGVCLAPCTNTSEFPTVGGVCKPCFEGCLTCAGPLMTDCLTCVSPLVKNTAVGEPGACVKGCSSTHQYADADGVCQECDASCLTCKGAGLYKCLTCASGQQKHPPETDKLGLCSICQQHQFLDTAGTGYCEECSYGCATCHGAQFNNCMSCDATVFRTLIIVGTSTYPYESECQCMNYYVQETDTSDASLTVCNACHYSCMQCQTSATEAACTVCEEAKGRIFDNSTNKCICNELGFFTIADQLQCGICFPTCKKCTNNSRFGCLECHGLVDVATDGSCGCPDGTYLNSQYLCVKPEECDNGHVGIVSAANANNTGNICGPKPCPIPYFYNFSSYECKDKCFTGCLTCVNGNETSCETCIASNYLTFVSGTLGSCTANCDKQYYYVPASMNPLNKSTCDTKCPAGYGPVENTTQKCEKCHSICKTCYKANDEFACQSCESPLSLSDSFGTQQFNNIAMSKITCQKCAPGYYQAISPKINDTTVTAATEVCIAKCLKGQYSDKVKRVCVNCKDSNCITCSEKYDYCELCLPGNDLIEGICQPEANQESCIKSGKYIKGADLQCVETCGDGYYSNAATHICEKCDGSCASCSGGEDANKCLTCAGNRIYYKTKKSCVYNCPSATFLSKSTTGEQTCLECIIGCGSCTGPAIADCTQCASDYFMVSTDGKLSDCIKVCSKYNANTYGDLTTQSCQVCNSKCATCIDGSVSGCLSCKGDDIFSKTTGSSASGYCKVKSEQLSEYTGKTATDIASSTADELQQQATEIVKAFSQTTPTETTTATAAGATDATGTTSATKEYATTQTKDEIQQQAAKKKELISAVISTAKEMSAKESLTTTEAKSLVDAMMSSVTPEVSVTLVTSTGEKVQSTATVASDSSEEVERKFEKDEAINICDTLTNIADKIDVKENKEVTTNMFSAASDLLKQTSTLQQDKKVSKGTINSINDGTDSAKQEQIKEDMEVVKKVVEFCDKLSQKIKEKLTPGETMSFNTTEMKLQVSKFSTGDKDSLKSSIIESLSDSIAGATTTTTTTTASTSDANSAADAANSTTTAIDDTNTSRTISPPEIIINDGLVDHLNTVLDKMKSEGKNIDSLTVKKASYDLDINTLAQNSSDANSTGTTGTASDFTRASQLQQFGFELDDGSAVNISDLADAAQFEIQFDYIPETTSTYSCVYWNKEKKEYDDTGVYLDPASKKCKAKHLTDFIVKKIKKDNKRSFNVGILATVIPILICLILFATWFFQHKNHKQVTTFDSIGNSSIQFSTVSPFISILKAQTLPDAINKSMHFACYLITIMMLLVLYFRDSINPHHKFDKLLVTGIIFALSIGIIIKYFLGAIKRLSQLNPWIYTLLSFAFFATCSGITIWRMKNLNDEEQWNWFHAMYLTFIFDLIILDILLITALKRGIGKLKAIQQLIKNGGFFTVPNSLEILEKAKGNVILDLERGSRPSQSSSQDKDNQVIVLDDIVEGEQYGSRPESKAGILKN